MKRSEMLDILENALYDFTDVGSSCCNLGINKEAISKILEALENSGMKPPHHPDRMGSPWCNHTNWDDEVYEWESENG